MVAAASRARVATVMASSTSSRDGPGVSAPGYSKLLRVRRILPNDRNTTADAPNWALTASWIATAGRDLLQFPGRQESGDLVRPGCQVTAALPLLGL